MSQQSSCTHYKIMEMCPLELKRPGSLWYTINVLGGKKEGDGEGFKEGERALTVLAQWIELWPAD